MVKEFEHAQLALFPKLACRAYSRKYHTSSSTIMEFASNNKVLRACFCSRIYITSVKLFGHIQSIIMPGK